MMPKSSRFLGLLRGRCYLCGDPAIWESWVKVGRHDERQWLCEPHRIEFAPRDYELPRPLKPELDG